MIMELVDEASSVPTERDNVLFNIFSELLTVSMRHPTFVTKLTELFPSLRSVISSAPGSVTADDQNAAGDGGSVGSSPGDESPPARATKARSKPTARRRGAAATTTLAASRRAKTGRSRREADVADMGDFLSSSDPDESDDSDEPTDSEAEVISTSLSSGSRALPLQARRTITLPDGSVTRRDTIGAVSVGMSEAVSKPDMDTLFDTTYERLIAAGVEPGLGRGCAGWMVQTLCVMPFSRDTAHRLRSLVDIAVSNPIPEQDPVLRGAMAASVRNGDTSLGPVFASIGRVRELERALPSKAYVEFLKLASLIKLAMHYDRLVHDLENDVGKVRKEFKDLGYMTTKSRAWTSLVRDSLVAEIAWDNARAATQDEKARERIRSTLNNYLSYPRAIMHFVKPGRFKPAYLLLLGSGSMMK
jgi:hypothetical protein